MTVKDLKELLDEYPDEACVILNDGCKYSYASLEEHHFTLNKLENMLFIGEVDEEDL